VSHVLRIDVHAQCWRPLGDNWMCWRRSSSTHLLGVRSKSSGTFLESLIFLLQSGCVVSPIPSCGVAGSGSKDLVLYLLTITKLLSDK
jgi:hypothetical protein